MELPLSSFDIAHFSGVLRYLRHPEQALGVAYRSLKSGGMIAVRDGYVAGSWAAGPYAESVTLVLRTMADDNASQGGDTHIGARLVLLSGKLVSRAP